MLSNPTCKGSDSSPSIIGDQRVRDVSDSGCPVSVGSYPVTGVAGEIALVGMDARIPPGEQANAIANARGVYYRTFDDAGGAGVDTDSGDSIVPDHRVPDIDLHVGGLSCVNKDTFIHKSEDHTVFDIHFCGLNDIHAANAVAGSVYGEAPDCDHFVSWCVDNNSGRKGGQNSGKSAGAIDRNRLGNCNCPKTTWIEGIDLAAVSGLGNCTGESLAGCGAAAGVGVVADSGHPGARCLRLREG